MHIKYDIRKGKIIKRPTHAKIVRERRRLKKYKKLYDKGVMSELDIRNCYKSWRNSLKRDCNACKRSIQSMDALYKKLFPDRKEQHKETREEVIREAFSQMDKEDRIYLSKLLI